MIYFKGVPRKVKKASEWLKEKKLEETLKEKLDNLASCNISGRLEYTITLLNKKKINLAKKELEELLNYVK